MGKYLVTSGSTFRPFSYDELAKPLQQMAEAHNAAQDAYDQISLETNALKNYITDNPDDAQAKAMYDSYVNKLQSLQNNLWSNGYSAQTRRDLSAARARYASDITRLGKAVKDRQERSAAYWKTKHEHPDMIMGTDPGLSGLDNYLKDDTYGQNYYSYSGTAFTNQVGTDAKARAQELLRDPKIASDPRLAGWLTRITTTGFTSQEVADAGAAVRASVKGDDSLLNGLSNESRFLANILQSHLSSTGARGQVSPEEYDRLVEYGIEGLSHAIGKTDIHDISDKQWDYNKQIELASLRSGSGGSSSRSGSGNKADKTKDYRVSTSGFDRTTPESREISSLLNKKFLKDVKTVPVVKADGSTDELRDMFDAERITNELGGEQIRNRFGGIDPLNPTIGTGKMLSGQNGTTEVRVVANTMNRFGDMVLEENPFYYVVQTKEADGKWKNSYPLTEEFKQLYDTFSSNKKDFEDKNNVKLDDYTIDNNQWSKIAKEYNIPDSVPHEDYPAILATLSNVGHRTPAYIMDPRMPKAREGWGNELIHNFNGSHPGKNGLHKSDSMVIYEIGKDGLPGKMIKDYHNVLDKTEGKYDPKSVLSIYADPEDVLNNKIRFQTTKSEYMTHPRAFGNEVVEMFSSLRAPIPGIDEQGIIHYLMKPLLEPGAAYAMTNEEQMQWSNIATQLLSKYLGSGIGTPRSVILNKYDQQDLRNGVVAYIQEMFGIVTDTVNNEKYKEVSDSSSNPVIQDNGSFPAENEYE